MEVKETKKKNHNWIKELVIILLGILLTMVYVLKSDAAELGNKVYEKIVPRYDKYENYLGDQVNIFSYQTDNPSKTYCYLYTAGADDGYTKTYILYSFEPVNIKTNLIQKNTNVDGSEIINADETLEHNLSNADSYQLSDGRNVYVYYLQHEQYPEPNSVITRIDYVDKYHFTDLRHTDIRNVLERIIVQQVEPDVKYEIPTENIDMALTGFECNEDMEAFWTGVSGVSGYSPGEIVVEVKPSFMLMLDEGEELQAFEKPKIINVPLENYSFSNTYEYYMQDNPYAGRAILTLNFTPVFTPNQTNPIVMRGKTIKVTFDKNGEFGGYDIPVDGLIPEYSNVEFVLNNFNAISDMYQGSPNINCMWNGSSIDGLIDYVYSEIKVEIYCYHEESGGWKWLEYPLDKIVSIKTNRLDLNMYDLAEYALSNNFIFKDVVRGSSMYKDSMIRITPFYKGYSDYVYGKSIVITTTYSGGIKLIQQSNGDGFVDNPMYQELGKDYFDDHSPVGDYMDSILDGFDESEMNLDKVTLNFFTLLKGLLSATGQFPALFAAVFSFLPDYFISMIVVSLSLVIILRVIGR